MCLTHEGKLVNLPIIFKVYNIFHFIFTSSTDLKHQPLSLFSPSYLSLENAGHHLGGGATVATPTTTTTKNL
ncbi:hypothetical protein HanRHA438_Chr06g0277251 [Helianthus annuus]|uniref:Uncharacterized protein n=1 Tax=Helianthus annuus TaxID=4232 RepID=A0A251V8T3_HELAN|nr:hypothetical protein HanXRQr2_Chr06g0268041 [Helianthus annuus]KAJ0561171.1 hypothetical protein HanHA300_Chr06g0219851 [Helianthus annuus]KAJ0567735.1 hypothetical protein HanIR_Chr06g0288281 [Helianthus annuus]KAJ0574218.1 hypothetical protein HanHA89_Chr06g0235681 [Helianthus annuus]KAJ0738552.1 hypothetical protein HanLR1_Chr06g0219601 [Helianthus annuus]